MLSFFGLSSRKPAPQPPPEPIYGPASELESAPFATATAASPTNRKRKASDAVSADGDGSSPSQRPAQRRRLVTDARLSPQEPPDDQSCPSEAEQPEAHLSIPGPTASSPVLSSHPWAPRTPKQNASATVEFEASDSSKSTKKPSSAKHKARPAPTSDSEADGHATQSNSDDKLLPRNTWQSANLSIPIHTNGHNADSSGDTDNRHDLAGKSRPSHPGARVRKPIGRRGRPRKIPRAEPTDCQGHAENDENEDADDEVHEQTPANDGADQPSDPSYLNDLQGSKNDGGKQGALLKDDDGRVAIIKSKSNPKATPIILNEDVTDKKYTVGSIVDHRRDAEIDHAFELSVRWVGFTEPTWESERSIQAQVPDLLYKYWDGVGGRPITGAFRVFSVLRHWSAQPRRPGARGPKPKKRTKYLVQWEGYSTDARHTSVETEEKLRDIAPDELGLYLEHTSAKRGAGLQQDQAK